MTSLCSEGGVGPVLTGYGKIVSLTSKKATITSNSLNGIFIKINSMKVQYNSINTLKVWRHFQR